MFPSAMLMLMLKSRKTYLYLGALVLGIVFGHLYRQILWAVWVSDSFPGYGFRSSWPANEGAAGTTCSRTSSAPTGRRPPITALVGYTKRSRTSTLDCYLRRNLAAAQNAEDGGMLDRVIFVPETGAEEGLDWLAALVGGVEGYFLLGQTGADGELEMMRKARERGKVVFLAGEAGFGQGYGQAEDRGGGNESLGNQAGGEVAIGPTEFVSAWELARAMAEASTKSPPDGENAGASPATSAKPGASRNVKDDTLFIFISAETIFIDPQAIPSLVRTRLAQPEYGMILANVVNEPGLAWLHHKLGIVGAWRPETTPAVSVSALQEDGDATSIGEVKGGGAYPWRTSELPRWSAGTAPAQAAVMGFSPEQIAESVPTDFGAPIDFRPPFRGQRWLPDLKADANGMLRRQAVPTLITEETLVCNGPGKWPWTAGAMALYSLLEDLEIEYGLSDSRFTGSDVELDRRKGLARYKVPLWEVKSERLEPGFVALWGQDVRTVGRLYGLHMNGGFKSWIDTRLGKTGVLDGHSITARFVGGIGVEAEPERLGLESTDLLERFGGFSSEVGCWL